MMVMLWRDLTKVIWHRWKKCFKFHRRSLIISTTKPIKIPIDFYTQFHIISEIFLIKFNLECSAFNLNIFPCCSLSTPTNFISKEEFSFSILNYIKTWTKKSFYGTLSIFSLRFFGWKSFPWWLPRGKYKKFSFYSVKSSFSTPTAFLFFSTIFGCLRSAFLD